MRRLLWCAFTAFVFALSGSSAAQGRTIFRDTFQNGKTTGWHALGRGDVRLTRYAGNVSLRLIGPSMAVRDVSTQGYRDVHVSFAFAALKLADGDSCRGMVSTDGGMTWQTLFKIGPGQDDGITMHTGGGRVMGIDDNPTLQIGVRAQSQGGSCWADNITVTGQAVGGVGTTPAFTAAGARTALTYAQLMGTSAIALPSAYAAFAPPEPLKTPSNHFEGRLVLEPAAGPAHVRVLRDDYGDFKAPDAPARRLPRFDFRFVQSGNVLIPVRRGAIPSHSPEWEFILEPGRIWDEPGDHGYSRASLPFTLEERNANCMHNGVLSFLFKSDGAISKVVYEIGGETCRYAKFDMWGLAAARYLPDQVKNAVAIADDYASYVVHRLPTKPISELAKDYPGIDPSQFGSPEEIDPDNMTTYGLVVHGVDYVGPCHTRFGPYPYCSEMDLPSYSLAKSIFAGEASMRLALLYHGVMHNNIADYVPACAKAGTWGNVTFADALNMATGHYISSADQADEDSPGITPFFLADTHAGRIHFACTHYPLKARPGTRWVYHTADIYTLGTALRAFYRSRTSPTADFYKDVLVDPIFHPLHLNPAIDVIRRSYDKVREPFAGWGMTLHRDDIAKLADFLSIADGRIDGKQVLDPKMLAAALQRDPSDRGLVASTPDYRYKYGFWAWNAQKALGCREPAWIPFMSGYGGIIVAMMPNGITYYYVSDGGTYAWAKAAAEANRITPFCKKG